MKKISQKKALLMLVFGLLVVATSQGFSQLGDLPEMIKGTSTGVGIGLLLTALIFGNFNAA